MGLIIPKRMVRFHFPLQTITISNKMLKNYQRIIVESAGEFILKFFILRLRNTFTESSLEALSTTIISKYIPLVCLTTDLTHSQVMFIVLKLTIIIDKSIVFWPP